MDKNESIKAYSAWSAVCFFWGTTYLVIRIGVGVLPPALFAGIRFFLAGLIFISILLFRGYSLPNRRDLIDIAIVGIALLTIANGTVVWGVQWVPSGLAALIVSSLPFWIVGIESALPYGDKLSIKKVSGILVGFSGIVLLLWPDIKNSIDPAYLKGIFAIFIAPLSWGAGSIYSKYRKIKTKPLMAAALQMLIAGTILIIIGILNGEFNRFTFNLSGLAAIGYLTVFGSIVGYGSYIYALDKLPASIVSMYAYINPVIAVFLGWLVLGERLDWIIITATMVILLGVMLVKTSATKKSASKPAANSEKMLQETENLI